MRSIVFPDSEARRTPVATLALDCDSVEDAVTDVSSLFPQPSHHKRKEATAVSGCKRKRQPMQRIELLVTERERLSASIVATIRG